MRNRILAAGAALLFVGLLQAQSTFETADVHPSAPGTRQDGGFMPGGRVELRGFTMLNLVAAAYGVNDEDFIVGGPVWLTSERFDIIAKAPAGVTSEEKLQALLKALLESRFQLVAHQDKRDMPVFVLTAKKGTKLQVSKGETSKIGTFDGDAALNNRYQFTACSMEELADLLPARAQNFLNRPVVDETHLKGKFDFQLAWMGMNIYRRAKSNPDGPPAVGVFEALEKIGLHLEPGRRPTPVIVVDNVNGAPTPNAANVTATIPKFPDEFEVAEVRAAHRITPEPVRPTPASGLLRDENGRLQILSATLNGLLTRAFQVEPRMLVGAPKWMDEDRFDVIAKTSAADLPDDVFAGMLKKVLVEKFHLATHTEEQSMPVYTLLAGKSMKLKPSDGKARSECKIVQTDHRYYACANTTMGQFVDQLPGVAAAYVYRPMIDLTGIRGAFDFQFYWTPKGQLSTPTAGTDTASTPVDELTLSEALDKQLGLKLEQQKHPVPVLVIDQVERLPLEKK
jgi:uncharacterized protein (TIGR03435 family)